MKIQVIARVLNDPHWHPLLDVVVGILQQPDCRHAFDILSYAEITRSSWLLGADGIRASTSEFIKSSAKATSRDRASDAVTVRIDDLASPSGEVLAGEVIRIHPFGALTLLTQPLHVIVEDESSDGAFILWMARLLGRDTIQRSYRAGRLWFRHAGGKTQLVKSASALSFGVWPRNNQPVLSLQLRAVAMLDSDARFPGDAPNAQISQDLQQYVAFVHILNGRYIENYVPEVYARRRLGNEGLAAPAEAYFRMTESQRDHFPIRRGFTTDSTPPQPQDHASFLADANREAGERNHYRTVPPVDWEQFAGGFGGRMVAVYREPGYRCEPNEPSYLPNHHRMELNAFLTRVIDYL